MLLDFIPKRFFKNHAKMSFFLFFIFCACDSFCDYRFKFFVLMNKYSYRFCFFQKLALPCLFIVLVLNFLCTCYSTTVERCPDNPMLGRREILDGKVNKSPYSLCL